MSLAAKEKDPAHQVLVTVVMTVQKLSEKLQMTNTDYDRAEPVVMDSFAANPLYTRDVMVTVNEHRMEASLEDVLRSVCEAIESAGTTTSEDKTVDLCAAKLGQGIRYYVPSCAKFKTKNHIGLFLQMDDDDSSSSDDDEVMEVDE